MVQIPTDIVLAFILLVMFNFGMNLFLFYKWHREIDNGKKTRLFFRRFYEKDTCVEKDRLSYDEWKEKKSRRGTPLNVPNALHKAFGYDGEDEELESTPAYDLGKK